jgi:CMP-N,N'-diacetyllegionaminic acid synthase
LKVLIIGYGSIGKRHYKVLNLFDDIKQIDIVTKQILENKRTYVKLDEIKDLDKYDYFIIASETSKHYGQLKFLETKVKNKIIFCEKPLFEKDYLLSIQNNQIFVGYVLRFNPLLQKLKGLIKDSKILSINVNCGQYLPSWRPNTDYSKSYSAKKNKGGGVLLDLSHEIDYTQWLCGELQEIKSYQVKISDLEIDSDDLTTIIGKTSNGTIISLSIDYISKITYRKILLHTTNYTYKLDFINNSLIQKDKLGNEEKFTINIQRNDLFKAMHKDILNNKQYVCKYDEAKSIMKIISTIQEQNNG